MISRLPVVARLFFLFSLLVVRKMYRTIFYKILPLWFFFMVLFSFCLPISFFFYVLKMVLALWPFHAINFEIRVHISHSSDSKIYEDEHDIWTVFIQVEWDFFLGLWIIWPNLVIDNEKLTCKDWLMSWYIDSGLFACLFVFIINLYKDGPDSFYYFLAMFERKLQTFHIIIQ